MRTCFEKAMGPAGSGDQGGPGAGGMIPPAGQAGPGGCKNSEECKAYCGSHQEECQKFQPGPGVMNSAEQMMPQQAGPGGCKGPEECKVYCESHPEGCQNFQQPPIPEGPAGPEGQPGEFPPIGPGGCQSPEECQRMQNQMAPPTENLTPPPSSTITPKSLLGSLVSLFLSILKR